MRATPVGMLWDRREQPIPPISNPLTEIMVISSVPLRLLEEPGETIAARRCDSWSDTTLLTPRLVNCLPLVDRKVC